MPRSCALSRPCVTHGTRALAALCLSATGPVAHAVCNTLSVPSVSTSFVFNTIGDKTQGSISEVNGSITADCIEATNGYLFVYSGNNSSNTGGEGIAKIINTSLTLGYRLRKSSSGGGKTTWGNTTANSLQISTTGGGTMYSYHVDSGDSADTTFPSPGEYVDTLTVRNRDVNDENSPANTTASPTVTINVPTQCFLPQTLGTLNLAYEPQHSVTPATLNFSVYCNVGYSIGLNTGAGTLLGVNYGLSLSSQGGNQRTSATGRVHTITADITDINQFGTCPNNATCASANATSTQGQHYVEITF